MALFQQPSREVWLVSAVRTPIGSFLGSLSSFTAPELGSIAIREALARAKLSPQDISEVLLGCVLTSGIGQAPARQAALGAGLSKATPCTTIGKVCGSGLKAVMQGAQAIQAGDAEVVVAGGMESMWNVLHALAKSRQGYKMGHQTLADLMIQDGLWDVYNDFHMGQAGELCAREKKVSREEQDAFAKRSYERAQRAQREGLFSDEIVPIEIRDPKGGASTFVSHDEDPSKAKFDRFATLKPSFSKSARSRLPTRRRSTTEPRRSSW